MKTRNLGTWILAVSVTFCSISLVSCDKDDDNNNGRNYTISGNADGNQVVPAVTGTGSATISGTYNDRTNILTYNTTWTGLTGAPTSGGFYTGASGTVGTEVGTAWTIPGGATGTGNLSGTITLTDAQESDLLGGQWYYSYGTATNIAGEVRGQITATP